MKRLIFLLLALVSLCSALGSIIEPKEPAILEVTYNKVTNLDTLNRDKKTVITEEMKLRIGKTSSMFYPPKRLWYDSLLTNNFELAEQIYRAANPPGQKRYVSLGGNEREFIFRNVRENLTLVYQSSGESEYYIEETELPEWSIESDTKEILGYECIKATCDYRGRHWTAWFAPEVPFKEGPWKLAGLPGLVLEAYDTNSDYHFTASAITDSGLQPVGIYIYINQTPFVYKSRLKVLSRLWREILQGNSTYRLQSLHGKPGAARPPHKSKYDFLETDYPHE
ncbi:MAG: GLPGLI family protein [Muribaculaceae bacterium]|nr:GLPGLI family protein [Muribaculaceae bacterium]